ncbi:MAG: GHKL domain-containing protein [Bacilli bacterium]|nr:GHKL domain-containing protein [Bacilli bacterium]MDD4282214.1 GHKL domain-containing protein [Bacilli bacterium]
MVYLLNSFIFSLASFYVSSKILKIPINYKKINYWFFVVLNSLLITISFIATTHFLKVIFNYIVLVVLNKLYFRKKITDTIMGSFFVFVLIMISEMLVVIFLVSLFNVDYEELSKFYLGQLSINLFISLILVSIVNINKINSFFGTLSDRVKSKTINTMLPITIFLISVYSAYYYYLYLETNVLLVMVIGVVLITVITILVMNVLKEKSYNINLKNEYDELINNLNEYEKVLEKYRMNNHENKNNLVVLKGMLEDNVTNAVKYIDEIILLKQSDDEEILFKTKKLPTGGFQGLVYQKMLIMKEKKILCNLEISRNVNINKFKDFDFELNKNFCTIIGILIDNAIESVNDLEKKYVGLYLYFEEDHFVISISNTFFGLIDLDKMDKVGYSSKGEGRGYGLSLVKKIIEKDKRITIKHEIINDIFKQKVKIKM